MICEDESYNILLIFNIIVIVGSYVIILLFYYISYFRIIETCHLLAGLCFVRQDINQTQKKFHYSLFQFPKNEILREKWEKSIPRANLVVNSKTVICEKHFHLIKLLELGNLVLVLQKSRYYLGTVTYPLFNESFFIKKCLKRFYR